MCVCAWHSATMPLVIMQRLLSCWNNLVEEEDDESLLRLLSNCYDVLERREDALVSWIRLEQLYPDSLEIAKQLAQRFF